jgi:putative ABC transport system ATP-binding protein
MFIPSLMITYGRPVTFHIGKTYLSEMTTTSWLRTVDLTRDYRRGPQTIRALNSVSLEISQGEFIGIVGASGSGKTTLLNLLAGLDTATSGSVDFNGESLGGMTRRRIAEYRARRVGIVFQSFNLLPHCTALQNVETALLFNDTPARERRNRALDALGLLGLSDRTDHRPADLSGGEQQRVALARAIVKQPDLLLADEPTGNLDHDTTGQIASILTEMNRTGLTIVLITHNLDFAHATARRVIRMSYGSVVGDAPAGVGNGGTP